MVLKMFTLFVLMAAVACSSEFGTSTMPAPTETVEPRTISPDPSPTTTSAEPPPTLGISNLEVIGLVQEYLEMRTIWEGRAAYNIGDYHYGSSLRETDCRTYVLKYADRGWEASQSTDGGWTVTARSYPTEDKEGISWEWRLFPSGVITTIRGPC